MGELKNINGIILAGGKSLRMGQSKAFLEINGKPFIQYCIDVLTPYVDEIIVVSDNAQFDTFPITRIEDDIKNAGPLSGLYSGLNYSKTAYNLVLSCDVPFVKDSLMQKLVEAIDHETDVVQTESEGRTHPLVALYKKDCAPTLKTQLEKGERRLRIAVKLLKGKILYLNETEASQVRNINTPSEYKALKHEIEH